MLPQPIAEIELRPVTDADLEVFFEHQREPEANEMAAFPARERDAFTNHWRKILADESVTTATVVFNQAIAGNI